MLRSPIVIRASKGRAYEHLDPRDEDAVRPTPLAPYGIYHLGAENTDYQLTYSTVSSLISEARLDKAIEATRLDEDDPSQAVARAKQETQSGLGGQIRRNDQSFERLLGEIERRGVPIDDEMFAIIQAARRRTADLPQLVRLIKEYPQMISIETFKFVKPFSAKDRIEAEAVFKEQVAHLQAVFEDAEVAIHEPWAELKRPFIAENGVRVRKYVAARIRSRDSDTELIVKETDLIVPPSFAATMEDAPGEVGKVTIGGTDYEAVMMPLGVIGYLRATDYKERPGYMGPELAERALGEHALMLAFESEQREQLELLGHDASILANLPPDMVQAYILGAMSVARRIDAR